MSISAKKATTARRRTSSAVATRRRKPEPNAVMLKDSASVLRGVRNRVETMKAIAYVANAALRLQSARSGLDVAHVLQQSVGDEIGREINYFDIVLAEAAESDEPRSSER